MWKFFKYLTVGVLLSILLLGLYISSEFNNDIYKWREKLTIEVETPEGLKSASAVQLNVWRHSHGEFILMSARGLFINALGEAPVLEFETGQYLFVLFKGGQGHHQFRVSDIYYEGLAAAIKSRNASLSGSRLTVPSRELEIENVVQAIKASKGTVFEIPRRFYPLLVSFKDIKDPSSVIDIRPDELEFFGKNIKLRRITMEITDEPVTRGQVEQVLGWIDQYYNTMFDGNRYQTIKATNKFANSLASGTFKTEKSK